MKINGQNQPQNIQNTKTNETGQTHEKSKEASIWEKAGEKINEIKDEAKEYALEHPLSMLGGVTNIVVLSQLENAKEAIETTVKAELTKEVIKTGIKEFFSTENKEENNGFFSKLKSTFHKGKTILSIGINTIKNSFSSLINKKD